MKSIIDRARNDPKDFQNGSPASTTTKVEPWNRLAIRNGQKKIIEKKNNTTKQNKTKKKKGHSARSGTGNWSIRRANHDGENGGRDSMIGINSRRRRSAGRKRPTFFRFRPERRPSGAARFSAAECGGQGGRTRRSRRRRRKRRRRRG